MTDIVLPGRVTEMVLHGMFMEKSFQDRITGTMITGRMT